jgi:glycosyltransferase involved in cell wall biosynthesis
VKRTLCIVNPFEHGGGAEYQIALLIETLDRVGGFDVHFLAHFLDMRARTRSYEVARIGGGGAIPRLGYLVEARSLYRLLEARAPAVIYQRVGCGYTAVCAHYARRRGIPLVWHVAHDTEVMPRQLEQGRNKLRLHLEKRALEWAIRRATRIVVQTAHQGALLRTHYGRDASAVIGNFQPPAREALDKSGPVTVLWIANLKPWKRPEVFVRLASAFARRPEVRFLMVGATAAGAGNRAWQEQLLARIGALDNLEYVGEKTQAEVEALFARAHIFVNTSTHEGFPNTFIQAWLRDVAVVSLSVDPDGILERARVGLLAGDEAGLEHAIAELVDRPQLRAEYARRGREHALAHHSMANAERLIDQLRA